MKHFRLIMSEYIGFKNEVVYFPMFLFLMQLATTKLEEIFFCKDYFQ